jgi:predicted acetyltransferase
MDFEITYPKSEKELNEIADLFGKVFAGRDYYEFNRIRMAYHKNDPFFKPEYSRIAKYKGEIVSHVSIVEKHFRIGGSVVKTGGIGDVLTIPEFRGKHLTHKLMNDALDYMRANDFPLSMLYGIPGFYHKFGYIEAGLKYRWSVPLGNLAVLKSGKKVRQAGEDDVPRLNELYNKAFEGRTLTVERRLESWHNIRVSDCCYVVTNGKDQPTGYVLVSAPLKRFSPDIHIKEAVAFDQKSVEMLLAFFRDYAHEHYQSEIVFAQRPDTYFMEILKNFGGTLRTDIPCEGHGEAMLRIVLLREFFETIRIELSRRLKLRADAPLDTRIMFKTDIGTIIIHAGHDGVELHEKVESGLPVFEAGQDLLVRLVLGYWSMERFLMKAKVRNASDESMKLLEILFPEGNPCSNGADFF